jgi:hypothetical protein
MLRGLTNYVLDELDGSQVLDATVDMAALHGRWEVLDIVAHNVLCPGHHYRRPDGFVLRVFEPGPGSRPHKVPNRNQSHDGEKAAQHPVGRLCERLLVVRAVPSQPPACEDPPGLGDDPLRPYRLESAGRGQTLQD